MVNYKYLERYFNKIKKINFLQSSVMSNIEFWV